MEFHCFGSAGGIILVHVRKTLVINAVGLTQTLLGESTPALTAFAKASRPVIVGPVLPAVTCSVQATYLTGTWPDEHGIVGNGWYNRDEAEIRFWRQSARLVQRRRLWTMARAMDPTFTCANLFWWNAMYSDADFTVTPRPMYPADGRKIPDIWTNPPGLREDLQLELGRFPLFEFWGPATSIRSTRWIADAAIHVDRTHSPTLSLVYLPHLDYVLQRKGPSSAAAAHDLRQLDAVCADLIAHWQAQDASIVILSEYGITPVSRPVHINRALRQAGLLAVREEMGHELLDAGASAAFAVADHQVAHVYVADPRQLGHVWSVLERVPGIGSLMSDGSKIKARLAHERCGEIVAVAAPDAWFTYYYWLEDDKAPDFARTVDIHRKPGFDPVELFFDPAKKLPKARIAWKLARRAMGMRALMDVIPLTAELVHGSHGRPISGIDGPMLMSNRPDLTTRQEIEAVDVYKVIMDHLRS